MKTRLIIVVVISIIRGCYSLTACSSSLKPVVGAYTATQSGQVTGPLYLDTGTGHNFQENLCRCSLSLSHTSIKLVFQSLAGGNSFNHKIEVAGYILNSTNTRIEVVLVSDTTDLWIRTDGVGGICVSVAITPPDNEKRFTITCFHQQFPILITTTSSHSLTSAALHTKTTETSGLNPTKSLLITTTETSKTQTNGQGQDNKNLIGPLVGGVSGFVIMVPITAVAICCIRKRKHGHNPNVTSSYEKEYINKSESPTPQQTYEYNQQPTYYNQDTSSLSDNGALTYEGITRHDFNEHIYLGISEGRTAATSKNDINDDDYENNTT